MAVSGIRAPSTRRHRAATANSGAKILTQRDARPDGDEDAAATGLEGIKNLGARTGAQA